MPLFPPRLSWQDLPVLARMIGLCVAVEVLRRRLALPALVRWFDTAPRRRPVSPSTIRQWVVLSRGLLRRIYGESFCMVQSLILFRLLRRHGLPVTLHFGIAKQDGRLRGHAWLEGPVSSLTERSDPRRVYTVTYSYPSARSAAR